LTLFISIGIGLGTLTALAFSTQPFRKYYLVEYNLHLPNESSMRTNNRVEIFLDADQNSSLISDTIELVTEQISFPDGANITILNLAYLSTSDRCFADTSIISETLREILKHVSNKFFYTLIGIVTIFYTITFVLALHRQNPRIRALKRSLNVLNKFDSYPNTRSHSQGADSLMIPQRLSSSSVITTIIPSKQKLIKSDRNTHEQEYEMSKFIHHDDNENHPSPPLLRKSIKTQNNDENHASLSEETSDELQPSTDKLNGTKQVSFQIENRQNTLNNDKNKHFSISTVSFEGALVENNDLYYKLPCPCFATRQLLIKFHFARPSSTLNKWFCCYCVKKQTPINHHPSITSQTEDETVTIVPSSPIPHNHSSISQSETLRKQLHQHRLRQIRMASTFLIITVSFVLFYLPSVLNADRIMRSPIMIYYLFLCTHALNPVIYCFMNPSLRAYVLSMFRCCTKRKQGQTKGRPSLFER